MSEESVAQNTPEMPDVPEQATLVDPPVKSKVSKIDQKRQRIFQERMQRFMSKGMNPQQAIEAMQREDYDRLPPNEKIRKLEGAIVGNFQAIARDIGILKQNQNDLADVMDVNFRAFEKMLKKLGVEVEDQKALLKEAEDEIRAERLAAQKQASAPAPEAPPEAPPEG